MARAGRHSISIGIQIFGHDLLFFVAPLCFTKPATTLPYIVFLRATAAEITMLDILPKVKIEEVMDYIPQ